MADSDPLGAERWTPVLQKLLLVMAVLLAVSVIVGALAWEETFLRWYCGY